MSGLIDRHDLVAALDRAAAKKVTVVSAPAGSGKTSLLRLWAERSGRRLAFVTVRPEQQFWYDVLSGIHKACGSEPPVAAPGGHEREKVLSELGAIDGPFVLVIDDAHELESPDELGALLAGLPPLAHAVVATRGDLLLGLHKLRLTDELAEVRSEQLRFTVAETRDVVDAAGITLSDHAVEVLHQRTEGWAAGVRLAVLSLAGHPDPDRFVAEFSGSDRTVAEYLLAEMLQRQPPDVQRLLLRTSLLDMVTGELADVLTGGSGADKVLLELEQAGAFVVSLDADRTWFRYHQLFGGLLRLELRRTEAGRIPALHRLAAHWYAEHAQPADAVRHLQAAGDWAEAARLLTEHALSLTLDGEAGAVRALLQAFPGRDNSLALVRAIDELGRMRLDEAAGYLEIARSTGRHSMVITVLDLQLARLRGHFDCVVAQDHSLPDADLRAVLLLNLGVTEAWSQRPADAERHLQEGAALARELNRPYLELACLAHLGFVATRQSLSLARRRTEAAIELAIKHGWDDESVVAPAYATLGWILAWTGDFDQAEHWLDRAMHADGEPGVELLVHVVAGLIAAARERHHDALAEFASAGGEHAFSAQVTAWTIATQARAGLLDEARTTLARAGDVPNAAAAIHLGEHDPAAARRSLGSDPARRSLGGDPACGSLGNDLEGSLLTALACCDLGDRGAATAAVEHALDLAEEDRLILPFLMTGAWRVLEVLPAWETRHAALVADILDVVRGGTAAPQSPTPVEALSPSELRVLRYLPTNLTRPEIAGELLISLNTVNTHIRRIYAKLGATDRSTAVERGRSLRLLARAGRGGRVS
ncbi:MAG: LuxR family transcriptional regulator, maltose regulon positive regulatory protein [Kribbellaceae bacterium]|nr:LuxR family transcriptional regulator, maltose regulon positive regulatory protein [Kribbellaceae bacterium]